MHTPLHTQTHTNTHTHTHTHTLTHTPNRPAARPLRASRPARSRQSITTRGPLHRSGRIHGPVRPADDSFLAPVEANAVRGGLGRAAGGGGGGVGGVGSGPEAVLRVDLPGELSFAGASAMRAGRLRAALGEMDCGLQVRRPGPARGRPGAGRCVPVTDRPQSLGMPWPAGLDRTLDQSS